MPARLVLLAICAWTAAMALFAVLGLPLQNNGDDYVAMADQLLGGTLPRDPFRPLLYPLLSAGLAALIGDTFLAAKLVSVCAGGLFVWSAWLLGRELFSETEARLAAGLVAVHGSTLEWSTATMTDMTFAAFHGLALWSAVRLARTGRSRDVVLLAITASLAYFTRYQGLLLLMPACWALLVAPWSRTTRLRRGLLFVGLVVASLLPHFALTWTAFGSPVHDENWRTMAVKYFAGMSFDRLHDLPFDGLFAVLTHDPAELARHASRDVLDLASGGLAAFLQGCPPAHAAGVVLVVAAVVGLGFAAAHGGAPGRIVPAYALLYAVAICIAFVPAPRVLLPLLPICLGAAARSASLVAAMPGIPRTRTSRALTAGVLVALVAVHTPRAFASSHDTYPHAEAAAARRLAANVPFPATVLTPSVQLRRFVPRHLTFAQLHAHYGAAGAPDYVTRILQRARATRASYVLLGGSTMGRDFLRQLRDVLPEELPVVESDDEVLVLRVAANTLDWIDTASVTADRLRNVVRFEVRLRTAARPQEVKLVGFVATGPSMDAVVIPLPLSPDGVATADMPIPPGGWTGCRFVPAFLTVDGRLGCGAATAIEVR